MGRNVYVKYYRQAERFEHGVLQQGYQPKRKLPVHQHQPCSRTSRILIHTGLKPLHTGPFQSYAAGESLPEGVSAKKN